MIMNMIINHHNCDLNDLKSLKQFAGNQRNKSNKKLAQSVYLQNIYLILKLHKNKTKNKEYLSKMFHVLNFFFSFQK